MKKSILALCLTVASISAAAQSELFLQPGAAIGTGEVIRKVYPGTTIHYDNATQTNYQIGIGYQTGKWRISTGVGYLRTGYQDNALFATNTSTGQYGIGYSQTPTYQYKTIYEFFHHVMVPLTVSYQVRLSNKFVLVPSIGAEGSYNMDEKVHISGQDEYTVPDKTFTSNYNSISVWAMTSLHAEYKLNERLSIFAGPSGQWMLTNFYKVPSGAAYTATQHNYSYLFDAGIVWYVHQKRTTTIQENNEETE